MNEDILLAIIFVLLLVVVPIIFGFFMFRDVLKKNKDIGIRMPRD
jgi:uncharacterized protein YneF (UPF0154 family)